MPYDRILDLMSLPDAPQLYIMGAYAKRVTIYSQQVRAINLVDAIHHYRSKLDGLRVAVVGGGIAGLTAAAQALEYRARVWIFEQTADFISIQSEADHRWVHPHLYEWPHEARGPLKDSADLPVLDWKAQTAKALSRTLLAKWATIVKKHNTCVQEHRSTAVTGIAAASDSVRLEWCDVANKSAGSGIFDIVILASGYGLEPDTAGQNSYWRPDGVDWIGRPGQQTVLIAGYGDGALTDLMRLCLVNFDHERLLKDVIEVLEPSDIETIRNLEDDIRPDEADELTERYRGIHLRNVTDLLHNKRNQLRQIVLTGPGPYLFDPAASTLNRLVVSQLLHLQAFQHIALPRGVKINKAANDDPAIAEILTKTEPRLASFSEIVLRFGTKKLLPSDEEAPLVALGADGRPIIAGLPESLRTLRQEWAKMTPSEDPTRRPLWRLLEPVWRSSITLQNNSPTAANLERYCLTIQPVTAKRKRNWLPQLVTTAMNLLHQGEDSVLSFNPIPVVLSAHDCVSSEEALAFTTRILCQAKIAIFNLGEDMGQANPAGMLLLGIRAAVRRGLTLVVVDRNDREPDWDLLPFNIKELLVLPLKKGEEDTLVNVVTSGWTASHSGTSTYRDLPVFDAVRQSKRRTPGVERGRIEIFALCPFSRDYLKDTWPELRTLIRGLGAGVTKLFDVRPVTEYLSPMLVGERLYDLARSADRCMVDWTEWRANVFFELGVRLAVNPVPPICVIKSGQQSNTKASSTLLQTFSPIPYDLEREESPIARAFGAAFLKAEREIGSPRAGLRQVYVSAERNAAIDQELGFVPLEQELMRQVTSMMSPDLGRAGGLTFLYHRNPSLSQQVWHNSVDRLEAALLLLGSKIKATKPGDDASRRLGDLRDGIASMLKDIRQIGRERGYRRYDEVVDGPL